MQTLKKPTRTHERATRRRRRREGRRRDRLRRRGGRRRGRPRATRRGSTAGSRSRFRLDADEIAASLERVPAQVLEDIAFCQEQVRTFAEAQRATMTDLEVETLPGVRLGHRHIPVASVGAYVPGGRYPMVASAHMSIVTAKVAGVERVAACTPPLDGRVPDATVAAMHLAGADEIYVLGGVQALAALALGTETIDPVDFLVGPGNAYVVEAKRQLFGKVGIDLVAGPTEILVVADETADPVIVAADLLGQAEHGPASPAVLVTTSQALAEETLRQIAVQLETLPTAEIAARAWEDYGEVLVVDSDEEALAARRRVRLRARRDPDRRPALVPRADAELRRALPRRGDDRRLRRQDDRHEPHPPDRRRGPLHRRAVGREVPQDRDLPGVRRGGERDDRRDLRAPVPDRELRGPRAELRRARRRSTATPASRAGAA